MAELEYSEVDRRNPARALNRVSRLITRYFDRRLAGAGVNVAYLAILGPLSATASMSQKELAASAGSSQAAMAELLARMVKDDLLNREQDGFDKRQTRFSLAPKGTEVMPEIMRVIGEGNAEVFSAIGDDGLDTLLSLLNRLEARLTDP